MSGPRGPSRYPDDRPDPRFAPRGAGPPPSSHPGPSRADYYPPGPSPGSYDSARGGASYPPAPQQSYASGARYAHDSPARPYDDRFPPSSQPLRYPPDGGSSGGAAGSGAKAPLAPGKASYERGPAVPPPRAQPPPDDGKRMPPPPPGTRLGASGPAAQGQSGGGGASWDRRQSGAGYRSGPGYDARDAYHHPSHQPPPPHAAPPPQHQQHHGYGSGSYARDAAYGSRAPLAHDDDRYRSSASYRDDSRQPSSYSRPYGGGAPSSSYDSRRRSPSPGPGSSRRYGGTGARSPSPAPSYRPSSRASLRDRDRGTGGRCRSPSPRSRSHSRTRSPRSRSPYSRSPSPLPLRRRPAQRRRRGSSCSSAASFSPSPSPPPSARRRERERERERGWRERGHERERDRERDRDRARDRPRARSVSRSPLSGEDDVGYDSHRSSAASRRRGAPPLAPPSSSSASRRDYDRDARMPPAPGAAGAGSQDMRRSASGRSAEGGRSWKRARSPDEDVAPRSGGMPPSSVATGTPVSAAGKGVYNGVDASASSKKAKTEAYGGRPPAPLGPAAHRVSTPQQQHGHSPGVYPPLPSAGTGPSSLHSPATATNGASYPHSRPPSGPRSFQQQQQPSSYPAPSTPLSHHPNALPPVGGSGLKVQLAPPTGPKAARAGFVPIAAQQQQQQQQPQPLPTGPRSVHRPAPTGPRAAGAGNGAGGGDVRKFFPTEEEEEEARAAAHRRKVEAEEEAVRAHRASARRESDDVEADRRAGAPRRASYERMDVDSDRGDNGWVVRRGGDVPPPRASRADDGGDEQRRRYAEPPRRESYPPPPQHSGSYSTPSRDYPHDAAARAASYDRPDAFRVPLPTTSANSVAPAAERRWGAPSSGSKSVLPSPAQSRPGSTAPPLDAAPAASAPPSSKTLDARRDSDVTMVETPSAESQQPETPTPAAPVPTELYERLVQVGEGTYGKVYKARNAETGGLVALKRIRMEAEKDGFPVTAVREIKLLQSLRHPNVVSLFEMMVSKGHVYMVFDYLDHDLTGVLHHPSINFSPAHLKSLMQQFLEGLGFIHRRGVLHRDLKGSNILLSRTGVLKIADFGLARFYQRGRRNDYTNRVITQWYKPPELLFGATVYDERVDMWSAGCIFLELFIRRPVFPGQDEIHQLDVIFKLTGTPNVESWPSLHDLPWYELVKPKDVIEPQLRTAFAKSLSPAGLDLAERLLALDPSRRPTADEALRMEYFTTEEPKAEMPTMLADVKGEWHEYESKRARKRQRDDAPA
ncbi:uncharacterized protein JCM10292_001732 [Rhodotorula paludigena]|uniref:uncharacterized protein n=1 Tax=Rhodotorula paludigena TaxID=86838 RepID=UPI0031747AA7